MSDTPKRNEAVARYDMTVMDNGCHVYVDSIETDTGDYVRYDDHEAAIDALQGEVSRLRAALEELICVCDPMQLAERDHESIVEPNERGGTTHYVGAPLLKVRWDDLRDFTADIKRAREALNLEPLTDGR